MSSINLNSLENTTLNEEKYTYVDFHLDFSENLIGAATNFNQTIGNGRDVAVSFDLNAIRNSLTNLFNTIPGERFLLPEYGSDLRRYVFDPISESSGRRIGREIQTSIDKWEPRVSLTKLDIVGHHDRNEYEITMVLAVPFLTEPLNLEGILTRDGYIF